MVFRSKKIVVLLALSISVLLSSCGKKNNPVTANTPVVDLTAKSKFEGRWNATDPISPDKWLYEYRGNKLTISTISTATEPPDTTMKYQGVFTLDSSATPHKLDVELINAAYSGKKIQTLYNYKGALGSFLLLDIYKNEPSVARPANMENADNVLSFYFDFSSRQ